jgi:ribosomal protein S18 acetylase RimI-like enzyme
MGIRPFNLPQDLDTLQQIIPEAFQYPENPSWSINHEDVEELTDMVKMLKRLNPLFSVIGLVWTPIRDRLHGYIWEEDGKPVGLCNVSRQGKSDTWEIGNVAVIPAYRRRGIARQLVEACVQLAKEHGAKQIVLDVIQGNTPARELYLELGFEIFSGRYDFEHHGQPESSILPRYTFNRQITPSQVQVYEPVEAHHFKMPFFVPLLQKVILSMMKMKHTRYWVMNDSAKPLALLNYMASQNSRGKNNVSLKVDNNHADLRLPLLQYSVQEIRKINQTQPIELSVPSWQYTDEITQAGFKLRVAYDSMGMQVR